MDESQITKYALSALEYDHINDEALRIVALRVGHRTITDAKNGVAVMKLFRQTQVEVWRKAGKMPYVIASLWNSNGEQTLRLKLVGLGMSMDDAEDCVQLVARDTICKFEMWRPWESDFWTWAYWLSRHYQDHLFKDTGVREESFYNEDDELVNDVAVVQDDTGKHTTAIDRIISSLKMGGYDAAEIIALALNMGSGFGGFASTGFEAATGLSRGQIDYRMKADGVRRTIAEVVSDVYGTSSSLPVRLRSVVEWLA